MKNSYLQKMLVVIMLMFFLTACGGSKELEEKNAQLQQEASRLKEQINASGKHWDSFREKIAGAVVTVDPLLLKELFQNKKEITSVLSQLEVLAVDDTSKATVNIDDEQLILRIKKFQGELLFRSWIDAVADRNVISVQHLKSSQPVVPGTFNLATKLWDEIRKPVEKKIAAGKMNKIRLKDAKMNFVNKLPDIDALYKKQVTELFSRYLRENSYEKPQVDSDHLLNGQFRSGGFHTISFKVTPVAKDSPWAVVVELIRKSQQGEQVLKSFELNPEIYQKPYKVSFTVLVNK